MGEKSSTLFPITFNKSLVVDTREERLSADGGAVILREIDQRLHITQYLAENLHDPRDPNTTIHPLVELLRTRLYLIAQGWKDADDADKLRNDPAIRTAVSTRKGQDPIKPENKEDNSSKPIPSQPTLSRLLEILADPNNRKVLRQSLIQAAKDSIRARRRHRFQQCTIDIDSFPIPTYGHQDGSAYNGYYQYNCYHILVATLAETGDILDIQLRQGNVSSAHELDDFLFPLIAEVEAAIAKVVSVRGDAAMPSEPILSGLEERRIGYCFRVKSNPVLERSAQPYLDNLPPYQPESQREWTAELAYQAESWSHSRRIAMVIVEQKQIDLFEPFNHFFLVTDWTEEQISGSDLLDFYRQRGTMERWIGEFQDVLQPSLSCASRPRKNGERTTQRDDFACNEALLLLYALAYNLLNIVRRLMEKATRQGWSLRRVREQVLKTAVHFTLHARRIWAWVARPAAQLWTLLGRQITRLHPVPT